MINSTTAWVVIGGFVALLLLYNLFFVLFYEKVLFQGEAIDTEENYIFDFEYEELSLTPYPGVSLNGLLLRSDSAKGFVLYFHGNRGNLTRWGLVADKIREFGYDVLIMDYRGYGKSLGARSEAELYKDAEFFYDYAKKELGYSEIIIYGRSLGTAIATHLATQRTASHLILETPMTRIRKVIPILEFLLIYKPWIKYEFNSEGRIDEISCPITIIHGTDDKIVPYQMGEKLYEEISHSRKKLITINHGKHNNLDTFDIYQQAIGQILK